MGNDTKVSVVSIGGACAVLITAAVNHYNPELIGGVAGFEAAVAVILTAIISYLTPNKESEK